MSYSLEDKIRARELYVESGLSYQDLAIETRISFTQLRVWGQEGDWGTARDEHEATTLHMRGQYQKLKVKLVDQALESCDPQKIYALGNILRATAPKIMRRAGEDKAALFLNWMGGLISFIEVRSPDDLRVLEPHIRGFAETLKQGEAA